VRTLGILVISYIFGYCYTTFYFISTGSPEVFASQWAWFSAATQIKVAEHPILAKMCLFYMISGVLVGGCGLLVMVRRSRDNRKGFTGTGLRACGNTGGSPGR
jgi:hypothetical protein